VRLAGTEALNPALALVVHGKGALIRRHRKVNGYRQGVAVLAGGLLSRRLDRTDREFLHGSSLASTGTHGFLGKGDVMIRRPYLVAWPVGSDRRTRRPVSGPSIE
jgi:hypothetical protein